MTPSIQRQMDKVFRYQVLLTIVMVIVLLIYAPQHTLPFLFGSAIVSLNFFALFILWKRVFEKKSVALTLALIITKYAALGVILYFCVKKYSQHLPAFFVGLTTIIASLLLLALNIAITEKK
ncbi:MAG: hypothetical protein IPM57_04535 [Oligoflexia bacterium]|nr:hypothetical protein [Oligoflexia bacterium]